jgi:hypothetical protein
MRLELVPVRVVPSYSPTANVFGVTAVAVRFSWDVVDERREKFAHVFEIHRPRYPRLTQRLSYSSWRRHQMPPVSSLRPLGARSSHWYMPQSPSSPRA